MSRKPNTPATSGSPKPKPVLSAKAASSPPAIKEDKSKEDGADSGSNNLVTKSVAIGIGSAAIVAALMFVRRR